MSYTFGVRATLHYDEAVRCRRTLTSCPSRWVVNCDGDCFVGPTGIEPASPQLAAGCSVQLSYGPIQATGNCKLPVADCFSPYSVPDDHGFSFAGRRASDASCAEARRYCAAVAQSARNLREPLQGLITVSETQPIAESFPQENKPVQVALYDLYGLYRITA